MCTVEGDLRIPVIVLQPFTSSLISSSSSYALINKECSHLSDTCAPLYCPGCTLVGSEVRLPTITFYLYSRIYETVFYIDFLKTCMHFVDVCPLRVWSIKHNIPQHGNEFKQRDSEPSIQDQHSLSFLCQLFIELHTMQWKSIEMCAQCQTTHVLVRFLLVMRVIFSADVWKI